jgi:hypothetical protein
MLDRRFLFSLFLGRDTRYQCSLNIINDSDNHCLDHSITVQILQIFSSDCCADSSTVWLVWTIS